MPIPPSGWIKPSFAPRPQYDLPAPVVWSWVSHIHSLTGEARILTTGNVHLDVTEHIVTVSVLTDPSVALVDRVFVVVPDVGGTIEIVEWLCWMHWPVRVPGSRRVVHK